MSDNQPPAPQPHLWDGTPMAAMQYVISKGSDAPDHRVSRDVPAGWVPVTQELLDSQEPWLYKPCWLAIPSGAVLQGYYEWRQGRKPDRFYTNDGGDLWALDVLYVMPINPPASPSAAPQPQPVAQPVQASECEWTNCPHRVGDVCCNQQKE